MKLKFVFITFQRFTRDEKISMQGLPFRETGGDWYLSTKRTIFCATL
jgi:hypothetical protein